MADKVLSQQDNLIMNLTQIEESKLDHFHIY